MEHDEHSHTATMAKVMAHWTRTKIFLLKIGNIELVS